MSKFKMLLGGQIIEVFHTNLNTGQIHGWNLESPNLRIKTYPSEAFKKDWKENIYDIQKALRPVKYYRREENCKYHSAEVTTCRHDAVISYVIANRGE